MKKIFMLIIFAAAAFFAGQFVSAAQKIDSKWQACAEVAFEDWDMFTTEEKKLEQFCSYLNFRVGPECEQMVGLLIEMGSVNKELTNFAFHKIIVPKCGEHPR